MEPVEVVEEIRPEWTPPQLECYETRPEVTAYAGGDGPWASH
jgi:hypothetical protein